MAKKSKGPSAEDAVIMINVSVGDAYDYIAKDRNRDRTADDLATLAILHEIQVLSDKLYPMVSGR